MAVQEQIKDYIASLPESKQADLAALHKRICRLLPESRLWFLDGKNEEGRIVSNPNIGYGLQTINYADGSRKEFYQIGISANTAGISVYIIGLANKKYLADTYENEIGKAKVTGYCIRFKNVKDINLETLDAAILDGISQTS